MHGDPAPKSPVERIARYLRILVSDNCVFEIRAPKCQSRPGSTYRSTTGGYFQHAHIDEAAAAIAELNASGRAPATYISLNPVLPALLARANNRLIDGIPTTTSDNDILRRGWILIDLDPVRPADVSATDAELSFAAAKAEDVCGFLGQLGWADPVRVMSGNGHHLLYRIDLPTDDGGLVKDVLASLAARFDDDAVKIDRSVYNAARITKIAGTMARKGENLVGVEGIEDRPHRRAVLLSAPDAIKVVSREALEAIAVRTRLRGSVNASKSVKHRASRSYHKFEAFEHTAEDVRQYLEGHGVTVCNAVRKGDTTLLHLDRCPVVPDCVSTGGSDISVIVGDDGKIAYRNLHNRGEGLTWIDVRGALEPGYAEFVAKQNNKPTTNTVESDPWGPPTPLFLGPPPMAFPVDVAFPPALIAIRAFCAGIAEELQVPVDLPAMLLLAITGTCVSQKFVIEIRPGWREIPALWTLTLLESGERKSVTFRRMLDPLHEWEAEQAELLAPEIAAAGERRLLREQQLKRARSRAADGDAVAREEAIALAQEAAEDKDIRPPTLVVDDATSEAIVELLIENAERGLVASPEGDALDVLMGRYDEKARPNLGAWLKAHAGDRVRVRRKGRPREDLQSPCLNVAMVVQPEAVRGMFTSRAAHGRGLLARFLPSVPIGMIGRRRIGAPPVDEQCVMAYTGAIRRLLQMELELGSPRVLRLDDESVQASIEFEQQVERELHRGGGLSDRKAWGAKLCGAIARIAMVLHVLEVFGGARPRFPADQLVVNIETMRAALVWAPYLIAHERLAASVVGCETRVAIAERILGWLERTGDDEFSRRDCFTAVRFVLVQVAEDIDPALDLLAELGYLRRQAPKDKAPGRPASPKYLVNPLWDRGGGQ